MSKRADRACLAVAALVVAGMAAFAGYLVATRPAQPATPTTVTFPHGTSCAHPDPRTVGPCRAVRSLLQAANNLDAPAFCRHRYQPALYHACLKGLMTTDNGVAEVYSFQVPGFHVLSAKVTEPGVALVLVRAFPGYGEKPSTVGIWMARLGGWWSYARSYCASCVPPSPAG